MTPRDATKNKMVKLWRVEHSSTKRGPFWHQGLDETLSDWCVDNLDYKVHVCPDDMQLPRRWRKEPLCHSRACFAFMWLDDLKHWFGDVVPYLKEHGFKVVEIILEPDYPHELFFSDDGQVCYTESSERVLRKYHSLDVLTN